MEGGSALVRPLQEHRNALADAIVERLHSRLTSLSPVLIRSLISSLAQAIDNESPDPVVSWAQRARGSYSVQAIHDLVDATNKMAAETGEVLDLDFPALLLFLEIVKSTVAEALPLTKASAPDTQSPDRAAFDAVLAMLRARDASLAAHAQATGAWCRRLAEVMELSPRMTDIVVNAGVLHDVGKMGTPDNVLFKPGPLDFDEWTVMQQHAASGAQMLSELPSLAVYSPTVLAHRERWDGTGYPRGLAGEQIPLEARIVAVADAFHAMISERPYRPAIAQREAIANLHEGRGTQWDPYVVDAMIAMLEAPRRKAATLKAAATRG